MKRLLAQGFPDIYQLGKAFRLGDRGRVHNPEFTLLEWYRRGFSLRQMMAESVELISLITGYQSVLYRAYSEVFAEATGLDAVASSREEILTHPFFSQNAMNPKHFPLRGDALNYLMSELVEPRFDTLQITVLYGFPADLSSQALSDPDFPGTSLRFEIYGGGMELGNGYQEILDPQEYRRRFELENGKRDSLGKASIPLDERFFRDLNLGLPKCCGIALGLDRTLLWAMGGSLIDEVLTFPWEEG